MIQGLVFGANDDETICTLFYGKDSKVYYVFNEAIPSLPNKKFCLFMSTLFLVCHLNQNNSQLWIDNDLNIKGKYCPNSRPSVLHAQHHVLTEVNVLHLRQCYQVDV